MSKMSTTARDELVGALARRCAVGTRAEKTRILDELQAVTGFHRKQRNARSALVRYPAPGGRKGRPAASTTTRPATRWWFSGRRRTGSAASA